MQFLSSMDDVMELFGRVDTADEAVSAIDWAERIVDGHCFAATDGPNVRPTRTGFDIRVLCGNSSAIAHIEATGSISIPTDPGIMERLAKESYEAAQMDQGDTQAALKYLADFPGAMHSNFAEYIKSRRVSSGELYGFVVRLGVMDISRSASGDDWHWTGSVANDSSDAVTYLSTTLEILDAKERLVDVQDVCLSQADAPCPGIILGPISVASHQTIRIEYNVPLIVFPPNTRHVRAISWTARRW